MYSHDHLRITTGRMLRTGLVAGAFAIGVAACGSSSTPSSSATSSTTTGTASHTGHSMSHPMMGTFGSDCSMLPASGMGSLHTMSMEPLMTAALHNPLLSAFARDAKMAGLSMTLDDSHGITVFAPSTEAFAHMSSATMMMTHSAAGLRKLIESEVVKGHVTTADLAHGMTLETLAGTHLVGSKMGSVYEVGKASVICGGIETANATVYIVNAVLTPTG
jgi:uncharacterized surface protein with fasciclin (FAS1) repeats